MATTDEGARSFSTLVNSLEEGQLLSDLTGKLHELNKKLSAHAVGVNGKAKGELVLKLKLCADEMGTVEIDSEIELTEPKPRRSRSIMWLTKQGNLTQENPRQTKLPLVALKAPAAAVDIADARAAQEGAGE